MKKIKCFDISHRRDVVRECKGSPTLCARMGTGGNNVPIVLMDQGGDVMNVEVDKVGTLRAQTHGHEPVVVTEKAYRISSEQSNAMLSRNPTSGIKETEISPTLDTSSPTAAKAQGGLAIVRSEAIPINTMIALGRPSDKGRLGTGIGKAGQPQNTLSATHCHAVCFNRAVRKLTPVECERLQGFPDNYTKIPYRGKSAENCPDAPRYKVLGNSWAVPVVRWIGKRIDQALKSQGETK